jgi:membrane protease YdiL (CAAX protease family)
LAHLLTGIGGGILILMLSGILQALLSALGVRQTQLGDFTWIRNLSPGGFGLVLAAGALVAPFTEELFLRGIIFRGYLLAKGPVVAYGMSSALFAVLHLNLPAFLPLFVIGLVLAWLYQRTGSLVPCIVAHGVNNGMAFLVLRFAPEHLVAGTG